MAASDGVSILIVPLVVIVVLLSAAPAPALRSRMAVIESLGSVRKLSLSPTPIQKSVRFSIGAIAKRNKNPRDSFLAFCYRQKGKWPCVVTFDPSSEAADGPS